MAQNQFALACAMALVVLALACSGERTSSRGFLLDIATAPERCGDGYNVVLTALGQHRVQVAYDLVLDMDSTASRVRDRLRTRAYGFVYVRAEPGVPFGEFVELVDRVWPEAEVVSIMTPAVEALARKRVCLSTSCGFCEQFRARVLRLKYEN
jgi:hypothetical protein